MEWKRGDKAEEIEFEYKIEQRAIVEER